MKIKRDNHFKHKQATGLASVASKSVAPLVDQADLVIFITEVEKTMALPDGQTEHPFVQMILPAADASVAEVAAGEIGAT